MSFLSLEFITAGVDFLSLGGSLHVNLHLKRPVAKEKDFSQHCKQDVSLQH